MVFKTSNVIAFLALIVALPPFLDWLFRTMSDPKVQVLPPAQVDFRTKNLHQELTDGRHATYHPDGAPVIDVGTATLPTYVILPLSYMNLGDVGEDFLVVSERLHVKLGDDTHLFTSAYTTSIVPRPQSSWIGDTMPRLPTVLEGGRARSDEVVFVPEDTRTALKWSSFLAALKENPGAFVDIRIEIKTLSGEPFWSPACNVEVDRMVSHLTATDTDRARAYYVVSKCD